MSSAVMIVGLRPKKSLSLAHMTSPAVKDGKGLAKIVNRDRCMFAHVLTNISDQIRRHSPTAQLKLLEIIGNRHQSGANNGDLKVDEEEA